MKFGIIGKQDYSRRFGGSMGYVIVDSPARVDRFLENGDRKVIVEDDEGRELTGEMDQVEWRAWKSANLPLGG